MEWRAVGCEIELLWLPTKIPVSHGPGRSGLYRSCLSDTAVAASTEPGRRLRVQEAAVGRYPKGVDDLVRHPPRRLPILAPPTPSRAWITSLSGDEQLQEGDRERSESGVGPCPGSVGARCWTDELSGATDGMESKPTQMAPESPFVAGLAKRSIRAILLRCAGQLASRLWQWLKQR